MERLERSQEKGPIEEHELLNVVPENLYEGLLCNEDKKTKHHKTFNKGKNRRL